MSIDLFTTAVVSSFNDLNYLHFVSVADFKKGEQLSLRTYLETIIIRIHRRKENLINCAKNQGMIGKNQGNLQS